MKIHTNSLDVLKQIKKPKEPVFIELYSESGLSDTNVEAQNFIDKNTCTYVGDIEGVYDNDKVTYSYNLVEENNRVYLFISYLPREDKSETKAKSKPNRKTK